MPYGTKHDIDTGVSDHELPNEPHTLYSWLRYGVSVASIWVKNYIDSITGGFPSQSARNMESISMQCHNVIIQCPQV